MKNIYYSFLLLLFTFACNKKRVDPIPIIEKTEVLVPSIQRIGNAEKGYNYLVYGDYIGSGIPYNSWIELRGENKSNILNRTGDNAVLGYSATAFTNKNKIRLVVANCLSCHATTINNQFIIGLGNSEVDFTTDQSSNVNLLDLLLKTNFGVNSPEYQSFLPYKKGFEVLGPLTITATQGANSADKYAAILASHRNPIDLTLRETDPWGITKEVVPTDVPAWWLLKKKNTMFYTGVGTGDFARIMMASSLVSLQDSSQAREIDQHFPDVLAYIKALPSPVYKGVIDSQKALIGQSIYDTNCGRCHGSSKDKNDYPNLLVSMESIGTDPALVTTNFSFPQLLEWYNNSWFSKEPFSAKLIAKKGYVAPPLDGVWATAPYLHNGSVPTIDDLLNSKQRPKIWKRTFKSDDYDFVKVGWNYSKPNSKTDNQTYDTSLKGYGNQGHIYGDKLSITERSAVIEYLKTL